MNKIEELQADIDAIDANLENNRQIGCFLMKQQLKKCREIAELMLEECQTLSDFFKVKYLTYTLSYEETLKRILGPIYYNHLQVGTDSIVVTFGENPSITQHAFEMAFEAKNNNPWIEIIFSPTNKEIFGLVKTSQGIIVVTRHDAFEGKSVIFPDIKSLIEYFTKNP